jgi:hypothetical protein
MKTNLEQIVTNAEKAISQLRKPTPNQISGGAMNKVYDRLKTMTIEQIEQCKSEAVRMGKELFTKTFKAQCDYAISKKQSGEWA